MGIGSPVGGERASAGMSRHSPRWATPFALGAAARYRTVTTPDIAVPWIVQWYGYEPVAAKAR